jgi:two-component system, cell cycle sensor histidine kinase and response regulator CckA
MNNGHNSQPAGSVKRTAILIVEDEELMRELLCDIIEGNGYTVYAASDGVEAIERYEQHRNEIAGVLLDLGLPGLDGTQVLMKLKSVNPDVRIILASGLIEPSLQVMLNERGVEAIINKPYRPDEILSKIREIFID